jgi:peptidoglycan hydrolase-like protein with peptidoglycan-binding domain
MTVVDTSYWQGFISQAVFEAWASAGVDRIIHKAGGAEAGYFSKDSRHDSNVAAARAAGLANDHYFFNGNLDPATSADQLIAFAGAQAEDRFWFDIENAQGVSHWNPDQCMAGLTRLKDANGSVGGLYMSSSVTKAANWQPVVDFGAPLWVAQYGTNDGTQQGSPSIAYWATDEFWQYTSVGHLPAYAGNLDLSSVGGTAVVAGTGAGLASAPVSSSLMVISQPGVSVLMVQQRLIAHGISVGPTGADGQNGPNTTNAVGVFQDMNHLTHDLNVGTNTWARLAAPTVNTSHPVIQVGSSGGQVVLWQRFLISQGISVGASGADGSFGPHTDAGTRQFQTSQGIAVDGIVGAQSWGHAGI